MCEDCEGDWEPMEIPDWVKDTPEGVAGYLLSLEEPLEEKQKRWAKAYKELEALKEEIRDTRKKAANTIYSIANMWQDNDYLGQPEGCNVEVVGHFRPYYDIIMKHTVEAAQEFDDERMAP